MPKRIQLRRSKGWRKPEGAVVVSRPGKWGNPFESRDSVHETLVTLMPFRSSGKVESKAAAVDLYQWWLTHTPEGRQLAEAARKELRGKDLCCWCGEGPCHADVLLELANR